MQNYGEPLKTLIRKSRQNGAKNTRNEKLAAYRRTWQQKVPKKHHFNGSFFGTCRLNTYEWQYAYSNTRI